MDSEIQSNGGAQDDGAVRSMKCSATPCETCDMLKAEIQILADALRLALWLAHQGRKDRSQDWLDERLYDSRWKMCEERLGQQAEWQRVRDCIEAEKSPNDQAEARLPVSAATTTKKI